MSKQPFNAISDDKTMNTPKSAEIVPNPRKSALTGEPLKEGEHETLIDAAHTHITVALDGKPYTLPELADIYWTAIFERNFLVREYDDAMEAMIRIYGQPPYDDCSLSEYLEIVANGQLDEVRREFEELENGD